MEDEFGPVPALCLENPENLVFAIVACAVKHRCNEVGHAVEWGYAKVHMHLKIDDALLAGGLTPAQLRTVNAKNLCESIWRVLWRADLAGNDRVLRLNRRVGEHGDPSVPINVIGVLIHGRYAVSLRKRVQTGADYLMILLGLVFGVMLCFGVHLPPPTVIATPAVALLKKCVDWVDESKARAMNAAMRTELVRRASVDASNENAEAAVKPGGGGEGE